MAIIRRPPDRADHGGGTITRRAVLQTFAATAASAVTGLGAYGYLYERHQLSITRADVAVTGLPPALAGLRIGFLTDVHRSLWVSHEHLELATTQLMGEHPDLIVLGGDYVTWGDRAYVGPVAEILGALTAPHGVFAIHPLR